MNTTEIPATKSERYHTAEEIADRYHFSRNHIYRLARTGKIPCVKFGDRWRFLPSESAAWLQKRNGYGGEA